MTKKDFQLIADGFAEAETDCVNSGHAMAALQIAAGAIADRIGESHPRFRRGLFLAACFPLAEESHKQAILAKLKL